MHENFDLGFCVRFIWVGLTMFCMFMLYLVFIVGLFIILGWATFCCTRPKFSG